MAVSMTPPPSRSRRSFRPMAEINVTPMVDVMLVLLVIFMVSAPLMHTGVPVDLPVGAGPTLQEKEEPLTLTLTTEGTLLLDEKTPVSLAQLPDILKLRTQGRTESRIYLRADKNLPYGEVMGVMDALQQAGYGKVALISTYQAPKATRR